MAEPNTMTVFQGIRDTINININSLMRDVKKAVTMLEPDRIKLIIMLEKIGTSVTINPKFEWMEDEYVAENLTINFSGGYSDTATTLVCDDTSMVIPGDVLYNTRTQEVMRVVTNDVATGTLVVVRDCNNTGVTGVAIIDGDTLVVIGGASMEGDTLREIVGTQMGIPYNYTQIFRNPVGVTRTEANSEMYHGKDLPYQRKKKLTEHLQEIEKAFLFGKRGIDVTGAHPRRYTGGIRELIATNLTAQVDLTEPEWDLWLSGIGRWGSKDKLLLCSNIYVSAVETWAKGRLQLMLGASKYGMRVFNYITPWLDCLLMDSEILTRTPIWNGYCFALDMDNLEKRYLQNSDTKLLPNRQANDEDSVKEEYLTECGLERRFEKSHGLITGVQTYS